MKASLRLAFLVVLLGALVLPQEALSKKRTGTFGLDGGDGLEKTGWVECDVDCNGDGDPDHHAAVDTVERCEAYCEFSCMVEDCDPT